MGIHDKLESSRKMTKGECEIDGYTTAPHPNPPTPTLLFRIKITISKLPTLSDIALLGGREINLRLGHVTIRTLPNMYVARKRSGFHPFNDGVI